VFQDTLCTARIRTAHVVQICTVDQTIRPTAAKKRHVQVCVCVCVCVVISRKSLCLHVYSEVVVYPCIYLLLKDAT
jgi:hypothetical protein